MARGWESKSVEEQINERLSEPSKSSGTKPTKKEMDRRARREGLLLARARTMDALKTVRDPRYRAQLEGALAHLDRQISEI